ncbi:DegT/DnrJ/EryC1/StrS family aminotransferase [Paucidesulfovibrio longus]|uniref:DegT/DnrJ/EryC1/StrS family aminotransferase n=1 Tax=Paucidesulfovibrio longus TaxID=889 RepID=UPI0003B324DA|nr:DegT/DnrJ/EryC1/StrS aminotransferase family protein [Paucidesulfovibrio longus]
MFDIPLIRAVIDDNVKQRVMDVLDSGFLTEGPVTRELEERMAAYVGARHALAATSCTTGLELGLRALGVGPGHEVVVPAYTYPATAAAARIVGARPVIVDVDPETMLMDMDALEAALSPATRAVIPVSLFGNPVDHARLDALKERHGFAVVEDAACTLGAQYAGARVGARADVTVFSLHPRKFITSGEGGIVTTESDALADAMRSYKHFGMRCEDGQLDSLEFVGPGTNYKLSNVLAAIALGQMDRVDELLAERLALAATYRELLAGIPAGADIRLPRTTPGGVHSYQTFCVLLANRDAVRERMRARGVEAQIGSYDIAAQPAFQGRDCTIVGDCRNAARAAAQCLALPLFHGMTRAQQQRVVEELLAAAQA